MPSLSPRSPRKRSSTLSKYVNLRSLGPDGVPLFAGDVFKLGNTLLKVHEVFFASRHNSRIASRFSTEFTRNSDRNTTYTTPNAQESKFNTHTTLVMQKATTIIMNSERYNKTEEHLDDIEDSEGREPSFYGGIEEGLEVRAARSDKPQQFAAGSNSGILKKR